MKETGKYSTTGLIEAQFEPGSRGIVLKNKLGIKRKKEIDEAESVALAVALIYLRFKAYLEELRRCYADAFNRRGGYHIFD